MKEKPLDIRFTASEGTGGFTDPLRLYRILEVPSAVIADIDFLAKEAELKNVLVELGAPQEEIQSICSRAREVIKRVKDCAFQIDPLKIQSELQVMAQVPIDLSQNEDATLQKKLRQLSDQLNRLKKFKEQGIVSIPKNPADGDKIVDFRSELEAIIAELQNYGLFLVPVGELEAWLPVLMKGQSREDKSKWAVLAAERIEDVGEREEDVWLFMKSVRDFLQRKGLESMN